MATYPLVQVVDSNGNPTTGAASTAAVAANAGTVVVKSSPGRLSKVVVTTAASTGVLTVYDNASAASGTVLAVVPASTTAGTVYALDLPAANGIVVSAPASCAGVTLSYT
jgi:hypothetical protein